MLLIHQKRKHTPQASIAFTLAQEVPVSWACHNNSYFMVYIHTKYTKIYTKIHTKYIRYIQNTRRRQPGRRLVFCIYLVSFVYVLHIFLYILYVYKIPCNGNCVGMLPLLWHTQLTRIGLENVFCS